MPAELAEVLETVKSLERGQIADLAYQLLLVLDDDDAVAADGVAIDPIEVDKTWWAELRRRVDDVESGKVQLVSHEETVARARAMLVARRK